MIVLVGLSDGMSTKFERTVGDTTRGMRVQPQQPVGTGTTDGVRSPIDAKVVITRGASVSTNSAGVELFRCTWRVVDATVTPRQADLLTSDGRTFQAIYAFDGQTLRYCGSYTNRPAEFVTRAGDGRYLGTLKQASK